MRDFESHNHPPLYPATGLAFQPVAEEIAIQLEWLLVCRVVERFGGLLGFLDRWFLWMFRGGLGWVLGGRLGRMFGSGVLAAWFGFFRFAAGHDDGGGGGDDEAGDLFLHDDLPMCVFHCGNHRGEWGRGI